MGVFQVGDRAILTDEKRKKRHLIKLQEKGTFSTQYGTIQFPDIMASCDGGSVFTHKGCRYTVNVPTYRDFVMNIKRQAQIIYPKDAAAMTMWADVHKGMRVLESGIGQGALSMAILRALGGEGTLTSYEIREDFAGQAAKFIDEFYGEAPNHEIVLGNVYEGFDGEYDRIMLDLPEPWHVVKHARKQLVDGGIIIAYLPTILQVKQYVDELRNTARFEEIEVFEVTHRPWKVEGLSVRPEMWVYNHSAFIIYARKIAEFTKPVIVPKEVAEEEEGVFDEEACMAETCLAESVEDCGCSVDTAVEESVETKQKTDDKPIVPDNCCGGGCCD